MTIPTTQQLLTDFAPKLTFDDIETDAQTIWEVENDAAYEQLKALAARFEPSWQDQYESKWEYLYVPLLDEGALVCTAVRLFRSYKNAYHINLGDISRTGGLGVSPVSETKAEEDPLPQQSAFNPYKVFRSDEVPEAYNLLLAELDRFQPLVDEHGLALIEQLYPYRWRTGRIVRKHIVDPEKLISHQEGDELLRAYAAHEARNLTVSEISLNDYLQTAAICYRAAFAEEIEDQTRKLLAFAQNMPDMPMTDIEDGELTLDGLHKMWADGRHGGMKFLDDPDSKTDFMAWYRSDDWRGAHPFEIVYSGSSHGIMLYPPGDGEDHYRLSVSDSWHKTNYLKMAAALIANDVPFSAFQLADVVEYCKGESISEVNTTGWHDPSFRYADTSEEREQYFDHIEWDPIGLVERV